MAALRWGSLMEEDEYQGIGHALIAWFESQNISSADAVRVMVHMVGCSIGSHASCTEQLMALTTDAQSALLTASVMSYEKERKKKQAH